MENKVAKRMSKKTVDALIPPKGIACHELARRDVLCEALRTMLRFSDARGISMQRSLEEASYADYVSDLLAKFES